MVYAALEGAAVGIEYGLTDDEIIRGIAAYQPVGSRARVVRTARYTVIDDWYNANPDSTAAALRSPTNDVYFVRTSPQQSAPPTPNPADRCRSR